MDDSDLDEQLDDEYIEDSTFQACYVYRSPIKHNIAHEPRTKRLKRTHNTQHLPWPGLSTSTHADILTNQRRSALHSNLNQQRIGEHNRDINPERVDHLLRYISASFASTSEKRLPTALLLTGLDASNAEAVINVTSQEVEKLQSCLFVNLQPRQCPNLQTTLKNLIKTAISQRADIASYNEFLAKNKKFHPLNFDLELLQMFLEENHITGVIVSLSDVEEIDVSTVNDLVRSLHNWRTKISSVLLLGITSTRELFEHRISKSCLKLLNAQTFDFAPRTDQASDLLREVQTKTRTDNGECSVFLGPNMMKTLRDLNQGQGSNAQALRSNLRYLALSHFVADPISALVNPDFVNEDEKNTSNVAGLARSTASFRQFCENMIADKSSSAGSGLIKVLTDDEAALAEVQKRIHEGADTFVSVSKMIYSFSDFYQSLSQLLPTLKDARIDVELQLYQTLDDLTNCQAFDDVRDGIVSLSHRQLQEILMACDISTVDGLGLHSVVSKIMSHVVEDIETQYQNNRTKANQSTRTPVKSSKGKPPKAAKSPATSSKQEPCSTSPYSEDLINTLGRKLQISSLDLSSLLLHEAYILSSRKIQPKQNFDVQPRAAVERALLKPGDYLTCDCCSEPRRADSEEDMNDEQITHHRHGVKSSMPPACILFTLLQDAPTIINVRDLFDAFSSHFAKMASSGRDSDEADNGTRSDRTMTMFYRGLAELKMIGLIKASAGTQVRKRAAGGRASKSGTVDIDFVAKTSWAGS